MTPDEEAIEDTLAAVALIRMTMDPEISGEEVAQRMDILVGDRSHERILELLYSAAGLGGVILKNWHASALSIIPPEHHDKVQSPNEMLDDVTQMLVGLEGNLDS